MIRYILWAGCLSLILSCEKDKGAASGKTIDFSQKVYYMDKNTPVTVSVKTSEKVEKTVTFAYRLKGNGIENEDYEVSAKEFLIEAGKDSAGIEIRPKNNYEENRSIRMELLPGNGFRIKEFGFTIIPITAKSRWVISFFTDKYFLFGETDLEIQLDKANTSGEPLEIPVKVDENSSAKEGIHFSFPKGKTCLIPSGEKRGFLKVKFLKRESGKDELELHLGVSPKNFVSGNFISAKIKIYGSTLLEDLTGKWDFEEHMNVKTLPKSLVKDWGMPASDTLEMPRKYNKNDGFEIDAEGNFKVFMEGDLGKYFRNAELRFLGEQKLYFYDLPLYPKGAVFSIFRLSAANTTFSASATKIESVEIGMRILPDRKTLEIAVYDFNPKDFMQTTYESFHAFCDPPFGKNGAPVGLKNYFNLLYRFRLKK